jgi:hypothetical protein
MWFFSKKKGASKSNNNKAITELLVLIAKDEPSETEIERIRTLLLHSDVDITFRDPVDGTTLLYKACQKGHVEVVRMLLDANEELPNGQDMINEVNTKDHSTALYVATQGGHIKIVQFLLEHHADMNIARMTGATPIYIARHKEFWDIVDILEAEQPNQPLPYDSSMYVSKLAEKRHRDKPEERACEVAEEEESKKLDAA